MRTILAALVMRYIRRNGLRASVTAVAVMLGVALVFAIDLANATAVASFSSSVNVMANHVNLQVFGAGRGFDERTLLRVQSVGGVSAAYPIIEDELVAGEREGDPQSGEVLRIIGFDVTRPLPQAVPAAQSQFDLGAFINNRGIILSNRVALRYHARAGGTLRAFAGVRAVQLRVAAVLPAAAPGLDSSVAFVDLATAQDLFLKVGQLDRIDVIADAKVLAAVKGRIVRIVPAGTRVIEPAVRTNEIERLLRSFRLNLEALSYVALLVGMYLIYNTLAISVVQRKPEISTLRSLGAGKSEIFTAFLLEGALYGVVGTIAGLFAGAFLAQGAVSAVSHTVSTLYVGSHADNVVFSTAAFIKAIAVGIGSSIVSSVFPALEAASVPPAIGMRSGGYEERRAGAKRLAGLAGAALLLIAALFARAPALDGIPVFGFLAGGSLIAGASLCVPSLLEGALRVLRSLGGAAPSFTLALQAMRAASRRYSVAIASLAVAVAMMTSIAILITSFRATIIDWSQQVLQADLFIKPPGMVDASFSGRFQPEFLDRVARVPGVAAVDTFRGFPIPFRGGITYLGAVDFSSFDSRNKVSFVSRVNLATLAHTLPGSHDVLASEPFVLRYGLQDGDSFAIETPSGTKKLRIAATYNDYSSDAGAFIMDHRTFAKLYHDNTVDSIAVYIKPGADLPTVRARILRSVAPARIDIESNRELRTIVLSIFDRTFAITNALYVVSIVIAILGVVSTLFALVLERRRDIALLRYLGVTISGIRRMVYTQAGVVGIVAAAWGLALGFALSLLLIFVINRQSFGWVISLRLPFAFFGEVVIMIVLAAVLAAIYPASVAARIATAEALRDE